MTCPARFGSIKLRSSWIPRQVDIYSSLAAVYMSRNELSDAEAVLKQGAESNPQSMLARVNLGRFYLSQRKFAQAEAE